MDGTYEAEVPTPIGMVKGQLQLKTRDSKIEGNLQVMGMKGNFQGELIQTNQCNFAGSLNTMLGSIQYQITGILMGEQLKLIANTNKGNFEIIGKKVS